MDSAGYAEKLARMAPETLLPELRAVDADYVRGLALRYRFTYQELRQVTLAARDLEMWGEAPLATCWEAGEKSCTARGRDRKKTLLRHLGEHLESLRAAPKEYAATAAGSARRPVRLEERATSRRVLGLCPAYSEETVCCGLHTLDAVRGCPFSCSYCTIQTFYGDTAELEADLAEKLSQLELDSTRRYHIGTGQASDSLVWGNRGGVLDALLGFAVDNPNVLLELKSKSANVDDLVNREIPANVVCSWTLNTDTIIRHEERGASSLEARLAAARRLADRGVPVSFHFHPMVHYQEGSAEYRQLANRVTDTFCPTEITFVSMGSVTLIKPVIQQIRRRGGPTKILQMEMVQDHHGKLTYPDEIKLELFENLYRAFGPWHDQVFFYLCMETAAIWRRVLGHAYPTNDQFEKDFLDRCLGPTVPAAPMTVQDLSA